MEKDELLVALWNCSLLGCLKRLIECTRPKKEFKITRKGSGCGSNTLQNALRGWENAQS
jgi:hypothetical protein